MTKLLINLEMKLLGQQVQLHLKYLKSLMVLSLIIQPVLNFSYFKPKWGFHCLHTTMLSIIIIVGTQHLDCFDSISLSDFFMAQQMYYWMLISSLLG
jgi:hypothetical protein